MRWSEQALEEMKILHSCIKETIRLFPPLIFLMRTVFKERTTPEGRVIPKGDRQPTKWWCDVDFLAEITF